jgi:hypothetical protein
MRFSVHVGLKFPYCGEIRSERIRNAAQAYVIDDTYSHTVSSSHRPFRCARAPVHRAGCGASRRVTGRLRRVIRVENLNNENRHGPPSGRQLQKVPRRVNSSARPIRCTPISAPRRISPVRPMWGKDPRWSPVPAGGCKGSQSMSNARRAQRLGRSPRQSQREFQARALHARGQNNS